MKYLSYIISGLTILGFLFGTIKSYSNLEAKVEKSQEKVAVVEKKIETLEKENNDTEKVLVEQTVKLEYIQKSVDTTNESLKEILKELKK